MHYGFGGLGILGLALHAGMSLGEMLILGSSLGNLGVECTCFFVGLFDALLALYNITITLYSEHKT